MEEILMSKIPSKLRLDDEFEGDIDKVQNLLDDAYNDIAPNLNKKPDMVITDRDPAATDDDNGLGTFWLNSSTGAKFQLIALPSTWTAY